MLNLKYSHIKPGSRIRAWDFEPMEGRSDRYVEGVVGRQVMHDGAAFMEMIADVDTAGKGLRVGCTVHVPLETFTDSDRFERVEILEEPKAERLDRIDDIIRAELKGTGFTYGYIGNVWPNGKDDRSWRIFLPRVEYRPQREDETIGDYCTEERGKLLDIAKAIRFGFQAGRLDQGYGQ